jgi:hypothetical protein
MSRASLLRVVMALAAVAAIIFIGVLIDELSYASGHPYAYGPAKVIAWGAGGGATLSVAVGLLAYAVRTGADRV